MILRAIILYKSLSWVITVMIEILKYLNTNKKRFIFNICISYIVFILYKYVVYATIVDTTKNLIKNGLNCLKNKRLK